MGKSSTYWMWDRTYEVLDLRFVDDFWSFSQREIHYLGNFLGIFSFSRGGPEANSRMLSLAC